MCNAKKRIGIIRGGIDVIKVKNFKLNLALTRHKWYNTFILGMAYQLPFKISNAKKRIGIIRAGIDVIKVKNFKINLLSHSIRTITFLF